IQLSCLIPLFKCCIKISLYLFKFALVILCLLLEVTHVYMFSLCFNRTFSTLQLIAFFIHIIIKFILQQTHLFFISKNFFRRYTAICCEWYKTKVHVRCLLVQMYLCIDNIFLAIFSFNKL